MRRMRGRGGRRWRDPHLAMGAHPILARDWDLEVVDDVHVQVSVTAHGRDCVRSGQCDDLLGGRVRLCILVREHRPDQSTAGLSAIRRPPRAGCTTFGESHATLQCTPVAVAGPRSALLGCGRSVPLPNVLESCTLTARLGAILLPPRAWSARTGEGGAV